LTAAWRPGNNFYTHILHVQALAAKRAPAYSIQAVTIAEDRVCRVPHFNALLFFQGNELLTDIEKTLPEDIFFNLADLFNRPAPAITRWLINKPVSANAVSLFSLAAGLAAAACFYFHSYPLLLAGAFFYQVKNIADTVDGQLARALGTVSRIGRFLDSLSDLAVTVAVFAAIGLGAYSRTGSKTFLILALAAALCSLLQCSYYNYYMLNFLGRWGRKLPNRADERPTDEDKLTYSDRPGHKALLWTLQRTYLVVYGWQDYLMALIDRASIVIARPSGINPKEFEQTWYRDKTFLTMVTYYIPGPQIFVATVCAVLDFMGWYVWMVLVPGNLFWLSLVFFKIARGRKPLARIAC
jgi:CDP-alcohol phosphatidyltransferase